MRWTNEGQHETSVHKVVTNWRERARKLFERGSFQQAIAYVESRGKQCFAGSVQHLGIWIDGVDLEACAPQ
jgi:hypothetical protein